MDLRKKTLNTPQTLPRPPQFPPDPPTAAPKTPPEPSRDPQDSWVGVWAWKRGRENGNISVSRGLFWVIYLLFLQIKKSPNLISFVPDTDWKLGGLRGSLRSFGNSPGVSPSGSSRFFQLMETGSSPLQPPQNTRKKRPNWPQFWTKFRLLPPFPASNSPFWV